MTTPSIRVGDVGTLIMRTIKDGPNPVDVSGADVTLIIVFPDRTKVSRPMTYVTDGTDGNVVYKVTPADNMWTQTGTHHSQCIVRWSATDDFASNEMRFSVHGRRQV